MFVDRLQNNAFETTHQGIAISDTGKLLDGQHRLMAIVKSGIPAVMSVSLGLTDKSFQAMDCGIPRRISDRVEFDKQNPQRNSKLSAVASAIILITCSTKGTNLNKVPSHKAVEAAYSDYLGSITTVVDEVYYKIPRESWQPFCSNRSVLAVNCLLNHYSPVEGKEFTVQLFTGIPVVLTGDPVQVCREYLTCHPRTPIKEVLSRIYWAMNKSHKKETAKHCGKATSPWFLKEKAQETATE
jgi:hypothetical protein